MTTSAATKANHSASASSSQVDIELSELRDEVSRWKRRYYAERDRNQQLQDDVDRMEIKLKAAVRDGLARGRSTLVALNAAATSSSAAAASLSTAASAGDEPAGGEGFAAATAAAASSAITALPSSSTTHLSPPGGRRRKSNAADDARWQTKLNELASYKAQHGHCRVPVKHPTLGRWVNAQRTQFNYLAKGQRSSMTLERMQKLDELGFEWKWRSDKSKKKRKKTQDDEEESGDDDDEANEGEDDDGSKSPKKKKKKKKRKTSTALSTKWSRLWEDRYAELTDFRATHGHCRVPYGDGKGLGKWVNRHRTDYAHFLNGAKSRLDVEKIDRLNALGFEWTVKRGRLNRDKLVTTTPTTSKAASGKSGEDDGGEGGGGGAKKKKKKRPTRKAAKS